MQMAVVGSIHFIRISGEPQKGNKNIQALIFFSFLGTLVICLPLNGI